MAIEGYDYGSADFAAVLIAKHYPEKTDSETAQLRDYLAHHIYDFDRISFSMRIGQGVTVPADYEPGVRRAFERSTKRRIDFVGWKGAQATLVEAKTDVGPAVMGQLLSDRQLWLEEFPDGPEPLLVAIGRASSEDSLRVLTDHGITVHLYEPAVAG